MCSHSIPSWTHFSKCVVIFSLLITISASSDRLSWEHILENLNNNMDKVVADSSNSRSNMEHLNAFSGKFFQQVLPVLNLNDELEVYEQGTDTLPKWLAFDSTNRTLYGVPTDEDVKSGLKIGVRKKLQNSVANELKSMTLNVNHNRLPMKCGHNTRNKIQSSFVSPAGAINSASMIFSSDLSKHLGNERADLLKKISQEFDQPISSLYLERGNRLRRDVGLENGIRFAGPGDAHANEDEPGFTVSWVIKCGPVDLKLDPHVKLLKDLSVGEDFASRFLHPVLGWFVHTSEDKATPRVRRAIGGGSDSTPIVNTPIPVSMTASPSPSMAVPVVTTIQPSKSTTILKTTTPKVPTTKEVPTTTPKPPTTTPKLPTTTPKLPTTTPKVPTTTLKVPTTAPEVPTTTPEVPTTTPELPTTPPKVPTTQPKVPTTTVKPIIVVEKTTSAPPQPPIVPTTTTDEPEITILERIDKIESAYEYQAREVNLENLFQSSLPLSIELQYAPNDDKSNWINYIENDWIEYNSHKLFLLPKERHRGEHLFALKGSAGSTGKYKLDIFKVNVIEDLNSYKIAYNASMHKKYAHVKSSAKAQVRLVKHMAEQTGVEDYGNLRGVKFSGDPSGGVTMAWSLMDQRHVDCRNTKVDTYMDKLRGLERSNTSPGRMVKTNLMAPECVDPVPDTVPVQQAEANIWQRILIPVIVIIVLLLIIVLILCCVYHRKRRTTMQIEEDKVCLNQKKPVIFLEEFEEKPHFVSLQPLMLNDEKPPTPNRPYEPRADTPEGQPRSTPSAGSDNQNGGGPPPYI